MVDHWKFVREPALTPLETRMCEHSGCIEAATHWLDAGRLSGLPNKALCRVHGRDQFTNVMQEYREN
jgi:hypothetical protein